MIDIKTAIKKVLSRPMEGFGPLKGIHYGAFSISNNGVERDSYMNVGGDIHANYLLPGRNGNLDLGLLVADVPGDYGTTGIEDQAIYLLSLFGKVIGKNINRASPERIIREANSTIIEDRKNCLEIPEYVPAIFARYNLKKNLLEVANAGHPAFKIVRPRLKQVLTYSRSGLPLGFEDEYQEKVPMQTIRVKLQLGDRVYFISDGIRKPGKIIDKSLLALSHINFEDSCVELLYSLNEFLKNEGNDLTVTGFAVVDQPDSKSSAVDWTI